MGGAQGGPGRHVRGQLPWAEQGLQTAGDRPGGGRRKAEVEGWLASSLPHSEPGQGYVRSSSVAGPSLPHSESCPETVRRVSPGDGWLTVPQAGHTLCLSETLTLFFSRTV